MVPDDSDETRAPYSDAVRRETIDGYLVLVEDPVIVARARYYARETGNPPRLRALERAVESTILDRLLVDTGVDVAEVRALLRSDLGTTTISAEGGDAPVWQGTTRRPHDGCTRRTRRPGVLP